MLIISENVHVHLLYNIFYLYCEQDSFAVDAEGAVLNFDCSLQKGNISTCRTEIGELEQVLTIETPDGPVIIE